jgi:transcriptional regulator
LAFAQAQLAKQREAIMYMPQSFKEDRVEVLHQLVRRNPLGLLISNGEDGPLATSIPFLLSDDGSEFGILQAHLARANSHWQCIDGQKVLIVFQGPEAYISPTWYPSKRSLALRSKLRA